MRHRIEWPRIEASADADVLVRVFTFRRTVAEVIAFAASATIDNRELLNRLAIRSRHIACALQRLREAKEDAVRLRLMIDVSMSAEEKLSAEQKVRAMWAQRD